MEKLNLPKDVKVFGMPVKTFPVGVGETFDKLLKMLPEGDERPYYGISGCTNDGIVYIAAALETFDGEGQKYGCESYIVEGGQYLSKPLIDWTSKTHCIRDVFEEIVKDDRVDKTQPAIEVYKNMNEMICMVKIDQRKELQLEFKTTMNELVEIISSLSYDQLNTTPFEGSWTAAQVTKHVIKVNTGFLQLINGPDKETERAPDELVETIKAEFSNFNIKRTSAEIVRPENIDYGKEDLLSALEEISASINKAIQTSDLTKTCVAFPLPVYGFATRLEAVYFVAHHTKRHITQLKNITRKMA